MQHVRMRHMTDTVTRTTKLKDTMIISISDKKTALVAKKIKQIVEKLLDTPAVISRIEKGDILLNLASGMAPTTGKINRSNNITITAPSPNMLLHTAVYALLHIFLDKLPPGATELTYQQEERILMLDIGRKYYSKNTILKLVDSMCLAQFNFLQLHFSENEGFRIESNIAPEVVSDEHLTKDEVREIIQYARRSGIEIIPDLDSPGHLKQVLRHHPEWQLKKNCNRRDDRALNICNTEAVNFIVSLYQEYAELFAESTYFHIGGDEFVNFDSIDCYPELRQQAKERFGESAKAIDCFVDYVNHISEKLNSWGFIPRVWNDGFFRLNRGETVKLSKYVEITYWTKYDRNMAPLTTYIDRGYRVINFNDNFFYYVLGENAGYTYPTYEKISDFWEPSMYTHGQEVPEMTSQFPGVALAIWSDVPSAKHEKEVWKEVSYLLFAMMQKLTQNVFMQKEEVGQILTAHFHHEH